MNVSGVEPALRTSLRTLLLLTACLTLSACFGRAAVGVAGSATGAVIRTTGAVIGTTVEVVTQDDHTALEFPIVSPDPKGMHQ